MRMAISHGHMTYAKTIPSWCLLNLRCILCRIKIIKKVGKSSSGLLINTPCKEAHRQLSDTKYYQLQDSNHTTSAAYEVYTFLTHLNTNYHIDYDLFHFLEPRNPPRTPLFYLLSKYIGPTILVDQSSLVVIPNS